MHKKLSWLFFLIILFSQGFSQDKDWATLNGRFIALYENGKLPAALEVAKEALTAAKKNFGDKSTEYSISLNQLGLTYGRMGDLSRAESLLIEALERKKRWQYQDSSYITALNNLGTTYQNMGNLKRAEKYLLEAKKIYNNDTDGKIKGYGILLNNLGVLYTNQGNFATGETFLFEALTKLKNDSTAKLACMNNLASLFQDLGDFAKAEQYYNEAIIEIHNRGNKDLLDAASIIGNLSELYTAMDRDAEALEFAEAACDIEKNVSGESSLAYVNRLNNLGVLYLENKDYEKALPVFFKAWKIAEAKKSFSPELAGCLNNMGLLYYRLCMFDKSETACLSAVKITQDIYGKNSDTYRQKLTNLALTYIQLGKFEKVDSLFVEISKIITKAIFENFSILSELGKENYIQIYTEVIDLITNLAYRNTCTACNFTRTAYNLILNIKSLILDDTKNMQATLRGKADTSLKQTFSDWQYHKEILSKQYSLPLNNRMPDLNMFETRTEELEKTLSRKSALFGDGMKGITKSTTDIQKELKHDEAAIEFVHFRVFDSAWTNNVMYGAYILRAGNSLPRFVPLCEERELQRILKENLKPGAEVINELYSENQLYKNGLKESNLYSLVWQPMEAYLTKVNKVYYSPAGKLNVIAFHALHSGNGQLLMDKYELHHVTSMRHIASHSSPFNGKSLKTATLFGNPSFTMDSMDLIKHRSPTPKSAGYPYSFNTRNKRNFKWQSLPGTAVEVNDLKKLFTENKISTTVFTKEIASEENLKSLSGNSPQVLHLATHGFFTPAPDTLVKSKKLFLQRKQTMAGSPLLRTGLVLSGANYFLEHKDHYGSFEDGVCTGLEISQLNLANTELVVLSACETGLGDVIGNEGVYGLQRAFQVAGVKNMIVSLWKIPDEETAELMKIFYSKLIAGNNIRESFKLARLEMREKKYPPFFWAAFLLIEAG